jgi:hypothetical protein
MDIIIDKRIELLAIVQTLDNYWDNLAAKYTNEKLFQCKYKENIWDYFGKYKNHDTVRLYNKLCNNVQQINAFIELVLCYSYPPNLDNMANLKNNVGDRFEPEFPFEIFIHGLKQFYHETNFELFFENNQKEYKKLLSDYGYKEDYISIVDNYLGTETKNYTVIISALLLGNFGIKIQTNENITLNYSVLSPYGYKGNEYVFGSKEYIIETLWHEISHLTINDLTKIYINQFDINEKIIPDNFVKIFYTNIEAIVNEYIIRTITIRLIEIYHGKNIAENHMQNHIEKGFKEIESIKNYMVKNCERNNKLIKDNNYKELMNYVINKI